MVAMAHARTRARVWTERPRLTAWRRGRGETGRRIDHQTLRTLASASAPRLDRGCPHETLLFPSHVWFPPSLASSPCTHPGERPHVLTASVLSIDRLVVSLSHEVHVPVVDKPKFARWMQTGSTVWWYSRCCSCRCPTVKGNRVRSRFSCTVYGHVLLLLWPSANNAHVVWTNHVWVLSNTPTGVVIWLFS